MVIKSDKPNKLGVERDITAGEYLGGRTLESISA